VKILAIDPGKHVGWSIIDSDCSPKVIEFGTTTGDSNWFQLLDAGKFNDVDQVVMEDYKIRPSDLQKGWGHEWNNGPALQIIGAVKFWAYEYSIPVHMQQPSILPSAAGLTGIPYEKGKKKVHHMMAMLHGLYWLVKQGICKAPEVRVNGPKA
jgi:hypothetical protein